MTRIVPKRNATRLFEQLRDNHQRESDDDDIEESEDNVEVDSSDSDEDALEENDQCETQTAFPNEMIRNRR